MENPDIVFQKEVDPFSRRMWQAYLRHRMFGHIFATIGFSIFIVPLFFVHNGIWVAVLPVSILLVIFFYDLYQCYKWVLYKIKGITFFEEFFTITVVIKNTAAIFQIPTSDISTKLVWRYPNRQRLLILYIDNGTTNIAKVFAIRKKDEFDLEDIAYQIYRRNNATDSIE